MKITLTGSLGNISLPLAQQLIAGGHIVTIVSHNPERIKAIEALDRADIGDAGGAVQFVHDEVRIVLEVARPDP